MGWFFTITQEMRDLGLKGNELLVFAVIYGFSQGRQGCYKGSLAYLQETCGITKPTALSILKSLVEKGLLDRGETYENGVKFVSYSVGKEILQGVKKFYRGGKEILPNSNIDSNSIVIDKSITHTTIIGKANFNFKKSLMGIGVSEDVADAWLQVRKAKRAVNTEVAFNRIKQEITKTGLQANECITIAVANSWQGFQASWIANRQRTTPPQTPPHKESVFEHNLRVVDEMFGTNLHEQNYGNQKQNIDEQ